MKHTLQTNFPGSVVSETAECGLCRKRVGHSLVSRLGWTMPAI